MMFLSGREQLEMYNFSCDDIQSGGNKLLNENMYRDLCKYARIAAVNNSATTIPNDYRLLVVDFEEKIESISYEDIMMTAKGQLAPEGFHQLHPGKKQPKENQSDMRSNLTEVNEIHYRDNLEHKQVLEGFEDISRIEIAYYAKEQVEDSDQTYIRNSDRYKSLVTGTSQLEMEIRRNNIKHPPIAKGLNKQKDEIMQRQLEEVAGPMGLEHRDEKVRRNKIVKDKGELMRINKMIEVVRESKRFSKIHHHRHKKGSPSK